MTTPVTGAAKTSLPQFVSPKGAEALKAASKSMAKDGLALSQKPAEQVLHPEMSRFEANTRKTLMASGFAASSAALGAIGWFGAAGLPPLGAALFMGGCFVASALCLVGTWGAFKMKMGKQA